MVRDNIESIFNINYFDLKETGGIAKGYDIAIIDNDLEMFVEYENVKKLVLKVALGSGELRKAEEIRCDLPCYVKIKLTDLGKNIFYHQYDDFNRRIGNEIVNPHFPIADIEGYTKFQLALFNGANDIDDISAPTKAEIVLTEC